MPASTNLCKVLAVEDPSALEDKIGCMTGIFQMFDRSHAFTGSHHYGSKRVVSAAVHCRQVSACESPHHDTNNPSLWMFEDNAAVHKVDNLEHIKAAVDQSRDNHSAYSDSSDIVSKPCKAAPVVAEQWHLTNDQKLDQEFTDSEDLPLCHSQENSMSVQDSDQSSVLHHHHEACPKPPLVSLSDSASESRVSSKDLRKVPFLDIRDIVRASFHKERSRDSSDCTEKTRALLDLSHDSLLSKSLPRSSSVNGRDRLQMSSDGREEMCCSSSMELPRSSSVDARRGGSRMLGDWRTTSSLWSSAVESPRRTAAALREKDMSKASVVDSKFAKQFPSSLDVTRLTVDLKEHPRLSVSKDEHRVFNDGRNSPRAPSGARYPECRDPAATTAFFNFKEPHQSADFKDSCSASCTQKMQDGNLPRLSVDGTRDPPRASMSSKLSVDGRDSPRSGALLPRLKLYRRDSMQPAKISSRHARGASQLKTENVAERDGQGEEAHKRIPNVVARLMGLEELPGYSSDPSHNHPAKRVPQTTIRSSSREVRLLQRQPLEYTPPKISPSPPPPPPRQSDDYNYKQQQSKEFQQLKKQYPILSHDMQLSMKSSSSSSLPGSNQKETRPQSSIHHLHCYYDEDLPLQYQQEEGFQTHAEEKIHRAHPKVKSHLSLTPVFKEKDVSCKDLHEQKLSQTPSQLSDVVLTALEQTDKEMKHHSSEEPLCSLMHQEMRHLRSEKTVQGRTFLRYILDALQLKGPLHSPRRKQSRDVNTAASQTVAKPIVEESRTRMQMLKQQFLPSSPRLKVTVPKQENVHQAAGYQGFTATKVSWPEDLLPTIARHEELLIPMKQTNSCDAAVQDTGLIMLGTIPNTLITVPQCIDLDPITNEMTTSSHYSPSPAQPGDLLDSISSRSGSSGRSAVTSSVQTKTKREHLHLSSSNNGMACKGENGEAAANRRSSEVHQVQTSSVSSRHEPNGSGSDTEAASTPRMTRKERIAARSVKGSQEGSQVGRDISARSPRLSLLPQGKHGLSFPVKEANPSRPNSSSPGMRSMSGTGCPQLVENGKKAAWSKPFMVKDREDSKVTLLNTLRAQSTKQEFLKGRASSGPDTRRPYRSSSDSKLISRMTEKLTATNTAAGSTKAQGRKLPISELPVLSSKRLTGKHSIPAVDSKTACDLDTETRPAENTSTKDKINFLNEEVAPELVATAADDPMKRDESNNIEEMIESIQTNAPAAESRLDLSTTLAELDERGGISEVLTPRGVSVKKFQFAEFGSAEVVDQPSPVSVLDNFHFQEEDLSPSPRASKSRTSTAADDVFDSPQRHHLEETQVAAPKGVTDIIGCTQNFSNCDDLCLNRKKHVEIQVPIDSAAPETGSQNNAHGICLRNKDEEREYVRDILVASGVTENATSINCLQWTTREYITDLTHFNDLESRWQHRQPPNTKEKGFFDYETHQISSEKEALGRRVLFDGTNEILVQKLDPVRFSPLQWLGSDWPQLQQKPAGQQLVQEVWDELQDFLCVPLENNVSNTLYTILHKDLHNTAKHWSGMDDELGHISLEVEHMIVKELIEEIVKDLVNGFSSSCTVSTHKPVEAITRRQLFAH